MCGTFHSCEVMSMTAVRLCPLGSDFYSWMWHC